MQMKKTLATLGIAALAVPGAALAKPDNGHGGGQGHGHGKPTTANYVFKGTYGGAGVVAVDGGNKPVRKASLVGTDVQFDLTNAQIEVADTDLSGIADADDLLVDDEVVVQAKLPKSDPGAQPFAARKVVDQTNPVEEDEDDGDEVETVG